MNPHDTDPHRRNLSVTAFAFIVYYVAGGYFTEKSVRFQVVNMEFNKPELLAAFAWGLLFWFLFRYWQTRSENLYYILIDELNGMTNESIMKRYIKKLPENKDKKDMRITNIRPQFELKRILYDSIYTQGQGSASNRTVGANLHGSHGRVVFASLLIKTSIIHSGFFTHVTPYLLFYTALFFGVNSGDLWRIISL